MLSGPVNRVMDLSVVVSDPQKLMEFITGNEDNLTTVASHDNFKLVVLGMMKSLLISDKRLELSSEKVLELNERCSELTDRCVTLEAAVDTLEQAAIVRDQRIDALENKFMKKACYTNDLSTRAMDLEEYSRRNTCTLTNIPYVEGENLIVKVCQMINKLGVLTVLKFEKQINNTTMKINRMVGILWRCRDLPIETKLTIYHSLICSHLNYGILIWGCHLARNLAGRFPLDHVPDKLRPLNVAHNKAIRAIMCAKRYDKETKTITHTAPLLKHLKLLSLNDIYYLNLALFAFDCLLTNDLPEIFSNYIENVDNPYNSRSCANNAAIPQVRLDATYGSIKIAAAYMWNLLPIEITKINCSKYVFKSKVKSWLLSKYES